jgi:hypothetical protein
MTNEERDIISQFIARVAGAQQPAQPSFSSGSVPATTQPALPPIDREADALIADLFQRYPEARYRITQLAFVQEQALIEAQNRIKRLEWELQQAKQALQQAQQAQQQGSRSGGGLFGGLFGGGSRGNQAPPQGGPWNQGGAQPYYPQSAPPPPQYPPNYQPGMFQQRGTGFLGSALTTAAGVAGGVVAGNALMSLFSGNHGMGGGLFGGGVPTSASPWAASDQGYVEQGTWGADPGAAPESNQDYVDQGTWDQPSPDNSLLDNGGWDAGGGDASWDTGADGPIDDDTF